MIMKIVDIAACIRITKENEFCGMETYIEVGSKIQITYANGRTLIGYAQRVDYGKYPRENDMLVLQSDNGVLVGVMVSLIEDIEVM